MPWRLDEWNGYYSPDTVENIPMSREEIWKATQYLRSNGYPKPKDCPEQECSKYRPACGLGICQIAVGMCGDF